MKNYLCKNCGTLLPSDREPKLNGCPNGDGHHSWYDLGEVGNKNYQCKNCGILLHSDREPKLNGCPNGDGHHSWNYLGETGNNNYQSGNKSKDRGISSNIIKNAAFLIGIIVFGGTILIDLIKGLFLTYPIPFIIVISILLIILVLFIIRKRKNKE